jgi:hypothetical protein
MGYNTTLLVLNDALGDIANDPLFGSRLQDAVHALSMERGGVDIAAHASTGALFINAARAIETHHADETAIVAVGGNCATKLGSIYNRSHHLPEDKLRILRDLALELGYTLRKKPTRKR